MRTSIIILVMTLAASAMAQIDVAPPTVGVRFVMAETAFQNRYDAATRQETATLCTQGITDTLASALGFVEFAADDTTNVLTVTLGRTAAQRGTGSGVWAVFLHLDLAGPAVTEETAEVNWLYRSEEQFFTPAPAAPDLIADVLHVIGSRLDHEGGPEELVENLFSKMVLAQNAYPLPAEVSFLLPIDRGAWHIGAESEFRIVADVSLSTHNQTGRSHRVVDVGDCLELDDGVPPFFLRKIRVLLVDQTHKLDDMKTAQTIDAREIYLTVYRAPRDTLVIATPADLELEEVQP